MKLPLACTLLLSLAGCTVTYTPYIDEHKSKDEVLALFKESTRRASAFGQPVIPEKGMIRYFLGPPEQVSGEDLVSWRRLVDLIEKETPMRFLRASDAEHANFVITLAPVAEEKDISCSEITETSVKTEPAVLQKVKVEIYRKSPTLLRPCLARSLMVAIGFHPVDRRDTYSVLNYHSALGQPTSTDLYLISLMLKSNLMPDMSSDEIDAILSQQYDAVQLSPTYRKAIEDMDEEQRRKLEEVLQHKPPTADRKPLSCAISGAAVAKNCEKPQ